MADTDDDVLLELPAVYSQVRLARLVASGFGNAAGFDVDEIEDLRIAVDEACGLLVECGANGRLQLRFGQDGDGVQVSVSGMIDDVSGASAPSLSAEILDAVTDSWERLVDGNQQQVTLVKRRRREAG